MMFAVQTSRSDAVPNADKVAQFLYFGDLRVPERGHDSRAETIHSFFFAAVGEVGGVAYAGWPSLGPASDGDVGERAAMGAGQTCLL